MKHVGRTVVITGATGFVGRALCDRLRRDGWHIVALTRSNTADLPEGVSAHPVGDLAAVDDFAPVLAGAEAVVHLAAKVHVMNPTPADAEAFHAVNVVATRRLAEGAATAGVRRFLFVSSIKVNGEGTTPGCPFSADDPPAPADDYGRSKAAAEAALRALETTTGMAVTIIRPPVVYGPGVKANVAALARLCDTALPLPFGATRNTRSLIAVENLADSIATALVSPAAAGRTYLVSDGEDVSTGELVRRLRGIQGRPARLIPVPPDLMAAGLRMLGQRRLADRLLGSLAVDDAPIRKELGWTPPLALDEGLARMLSPDAAGTRRRPVLLFLVTEDWYFWSHRLGVARAAWNAGWQVHVACRVTAHGDRIRNEGFTLHPLPLRRSGRNPLREIAAIRAIARLYRNIRPDVVHHVAMKPVLYGSIAARLARVPAVVNAMAGMGSVFSARKLSTRLLRPFVIAAFHLLLDRPGQWLVVQNEDDAALFRDGGLVSAERIRLIPGSGVDADTFSACPEPPEGPIVATVVARMLWDKGIGEMVEAARLLRQRHEPVTVRLVGSRDEENPNAVPLSTLEAWHREGVVEWQGRREDIPAVWAESHIAVLPSYREGMPRSLLEAAARGRPLVTTDVPGCRSLVEDGANGLIVPARNPEALANAIATLANDPALRYRLGREARRRIDETFGDRPILKAFLQLYTEVSGKAPVPAARTKDRPPLPAKRP